MSNDVSFFTKTPIKEPFKVNRKRLENDKTCKNPNRQHHGTVDICL